MNDRRESSLLLLPGLLLLALAFFLPILRMLGMGFWEDDRFTLALFGEFFDDPYFLRIAWRTVRLSLLITLACVLLGFPYAVIIQHTRRGLRLWLMALVVLPLMTSVVIRTFGWMVILNKSGPLTELLVWLGLVDRNFSLMHTESAVVIGMVQVMLPFMVLSILSVLAKIDPRLPEAARTMGCSFLQSVRTVVWPLSRPGVVAGSLLVFSLSVSSFITPSLLGGVRVPVLAQSIYEELTQTFDWSFAAAQSTLLLLAVLLILAPYLRMSSR